MIKTTIITKFESKFVILNIIMEVESVFLANFSINSPLGEFH